LFLSLLKGVTGFKNLFLFLFQFIGKLQALRMSQDGRSLICSKSVKLTPFFSRSNLLRLTVILVCLRTLFNPHPLVLSHEIGRIPAWKNGNISCTNARKSSLHIYTNFLNSFSHPNRLLLQNFDDILLLMTADDILDFTSLNITDNRCKILMPDGSNTVKIASLIWSIEVCSKDKMILR